MPADLFTIPPVSDLKTLHREVNARLRRIALQLAHLSGYDAKQINMQHPLDLGGKKIQNVALPLGRDGDVVTCGYLRNYGLLPVEGRSLNVQVPIVAAAGINVPRKASASSNVVTLSQLSSVVTSMGVVVSEFSPPAGALPGTAFTCQPPQSVLLVRHGNTWQSKIAAGAPGPNQFTYDTDGVLVMGNVVQPGDDFYAVGFA